MICIVNVCLSLSKKYSNTAIQKYRNPEIILHCECLLLGVKGAAQLLPPAAYRTFCEEQLTAEMINTLRSDRQPATEIVEIRSPIV